MRASGNDSNGDIAALIAHGELAPEADIEDDVSSPLSARCGKERARGPYRISR
jgi:hypothetical protein